MSIVFQPGQTGFSTITGNLPQTVTFQFAPNFKSAHCVLSGFNLQYLNGDRPLYQMRVETSVNAQPSTGRVDVTVIYEMRDASGLFDDAYSRSVHFLLIIEYP